VETFPAYPMVWWSESCSSNSWGEVRRNVSDIRGTCHLLSVKIFDEFRLPARKSGRLTSSSSVPGAQPLDSGTGLHHDGNQAGGLPEIAEESDAHLFANVQLLSRLSLAEALLVSSRNLRHYLPNCPALDRPTLLVAVETDARL